jgi:hypothetical protein
MQYTISPKDEETGSKNGISKSRNALNSNGRSNGKIILYLRSRKIFTSVQMVDLPSIDSGLANGMTNKIPKRIVTQNRLFDSENEEALKNCKELAFELGLELEITDLSVESFRGKFSRFLTGNGFSGKTPSISLDGGAVTSLVSSNWARENLDAHNIRSLEALEC